MLPTRLIVVAFAPFMLSVLHAGGETNLLPNPSFESGHDSQPADWSYYSWRASKGWWDSQHAHSGRRSLGLQGPNGGWSTVLHVKSATLYSMRFHYRAEGPGRIVVYAREPISPRKMNGILYKPVPAVQAHERGRFIDGTFVDGADEKGWVRLDVGQFKTSPNATKLNILIKLVGASPESKAWLDDVVLAERPPRRAPTTARALVRTPVCTVWTDDENRKILPEQNPPPGPTTGAIAVAAARGEYESFQIAITPATKMAQATWEWDTFAGPAALPQNALRCRRIENVDIKRVMGPYSHKGLNPDALTDRLPCDVPAGLTQGFWFTLRVPREQTPGVYTCTLTLTRAGREVARVPLRLKVRGFAIPQRPSLDVRSSFRANLVFRREADDDETVARRYYRDFYEHRSRCAPAAQPRVRLEGDRASVDMDRVVQHMTFMRDVLGARHFNIPSLWIGHKGSHRMPPDAQWQGRRIFADETLTQLRPDFEKPFRSYMTQLVARLKQEGLFLDPIVRFFDEPQLSLQPTANALRTLSRLLLDIEPQLTVSMTAPGPYPGLTDVIKLWILHTDAWQRNIGHIDAARKAGCRIYVYNNGVNYPEHRRIRVRLWPWLLWKYHVDGTYSWWGTVCWRGAMENPWTCGQGGSGVLMYPPRSAQERGPIDSVRWELFREGLEDYEYMRLASDLAEQIAREGDAAKAKAGREAVAAAMALVERWPVVRAANDEPYTLDVTALKAAREQLAAAIEAMGK